MLSSRESHHVPLRDYQIRAVNEARRARGRGKRSILLVSPTGSGKTTIGAEICRAAVAKGGRVVWVAHRAELVEQARKRLAAEGLRVSVLAAGVVHDAGAQVHVASAQTMLAREHFPEAEVLVLDEAHHYVADEWSRAWKAYPKATILGLTATPERGDGRGLGDVFEELIVVARIRELTDAGHLVPLEVVRPDRYVKSGYLAQDPVDAYEEHAGGRRTVVFAARVDAAEDFRGRFLARGHDAVVVHGALPKVERELALERHTEGAILINVMVLTEGWDSPETAVCILSRGCGSAGLYLQITGRILRPYPGKTIATLIDLRGVCHVHGMPDEDREYCLEGVGIRRKDVEGPRFCKVCGAVLAGKESCAACALGGEVYAPDAILGLKLDKFAVLKNDDDETRVQRLQRWYEQARARGHKTYSAHFKYAAVYGAMPPKHIVRGARG